MIRFALFLIFSFGLTGWAAKVEETLATVNGEPIYLSDYHSNVNNLLEEARRSSRQEVTPTQLQELREKVLDNMVDDLALLQEARRLKIRVYEKDLKAGVEDIKGRFRRDEEGRLLSEEETEKAFAAELKRQRLTYGDFEERIQKQLMVFKLVEQTVKPKVKPPTEGDTRDFFKKVQQVVASSNAVVGASKEENEELQKLAQLLKDRTAERVKARHILIKVPPKASLVEKSKALNTIKQIKSQIDKGADFADMAQKHSQDFESAKKGGDLNYFIRGWMVPPFEKVAFSLPVGQVSDPIETDYGYHLILVEEKRAAVPLRFEDIEEDLTNYLTQRNFQRTLKETVANLRSKADVKIKKHLIQETAEGEVKSSAPKEGKP